MTTPEHPNDFGSAKMSLGAELVSTVGKSRAIQIVVLGITLIIIAVSATISSANIDNTLRLTLVGLGGAISLIGVYMEMMTYLQSSRQSSLSNSAIKDLDIQIEKLYSGLKSVQSDVKEIRKLPNSTILSAEEKERTILAAANSLNEDIVERISGRWESKYSKTAVTGENMKRLILVADDMRSRLQDEVSALGKRANTNLTWGTIIAISGIGILAYFIWTTAQELGSGLSSGDIALRFAIRLSLVIFIQIFSYFFLRLYRYSIFETKYFQNEITNIDSKIIALHAALIADEKTLVGKIALELSKTERNFILKKGDTTIGLRREELELNYETDLLSKLERIATFKSEKNKKNADAGS